MRRTVVWRHIAEPEEVILWPPPSAAVLAKLSLRAFSENGYFSVLVFTSIPRSDHLQGRPEGVWERRFGARRLTPDNDLQAESF